MGSRPSLMLQEPEIEEIKADTGCGFGCGCFIILDKRAQGYLTREDFLRIPELAVNPLGNRIIDGFLDKEHVTFKRFIHELARFRPSDEKAHEDALNSREAKLRFVFNMYDLSGSGKITIEEFATMLDQMSGGNLTKNQLRNIAERTIAEADDNDDGAVSFTEFCHAMQSTDIEQKLAIRFLD